MKKVFYITLALLIVSNGCDQHRAKRIYNASRSKVGFDDIGAIADLTKAIKLDPHYKNSYYNRACAYFNTANYKAAIDDFTQVIMFEPDCKECYSFRGECKYYLEDYGAAIIDYNKAIELYKYDGSLSSIDRLFLLRGDAKFMLGDYKGAIADYNNACDEGYFNNPTSESFVKRGKAKSRMNDTKGPIVDFNKAIEIYPNNSNAYYYRGITKISLGQKNAGCLDLRKAGELGDSRAYKYIGIYCQ